MIRNDKGKAAIKQTSFATGSSKGQAAMEYLMTYGWAILVLVIVMAMLYYFLPKVQESCLFQQNFECEGLPQIYTLHSGEDLLVSAKLSNRLPQTIENITVICTNAGSGDITNTLFEDAKSNNNHEYFEISKDSIGAGSSFDVKNILCVNSKGQMLKTSEGSGFKGSLAVMYSLDTDVNKDIQHISIGTISGTVLSG